MKQIFLMIVSLILLVNIGFGQQTSDVRRTYNWYFGSKAGLDFSSGSPVATTDSQMSADEGSASISDTCGNLLFYTNGVEIWNRNHQIMENGTDLFGCISSTQAALIVPKPSNDSLFYVFTTDCLGNPNNYGVRYSIVNMNGDNGLGSVFEKNTILQTTTLEKLIGTYHQNEKDIWIVVNNSYPIGSPPDTTYNYYVYLLTENGIQDPVISPSRIHPHKQGVGYSSFSHDGNKIANSWASYLDTIEIANFDKETGEISDNILIILNTPVYYESTYGLCFSSDDSKLYLSTILAQDFPNWFSNVYRFDLSIFDSTFISNSKSILKHSDTSLQNLPFYFALQTGIDEVLYIYKYNNLGTNTTFLDGIINANGEDLYNENIVDLENEQIGAGLPNFVSNYLSSNFAEPCTNNLNEDLAKNNNILVYPNPFSEFTNIIFPFNILNKFNAILTDFTGKIIREYVIDNDNYSLNCKGLGPGFYFLDFENNNLKYKIKLIIQ